MHRWNPMHLLKYHFPENLDNGLYSKIIFQNLLSHMVDKFDLDCFLHQDNDSKHTSRVNANLLDSLGIIWVKQYQNK